MLDLLKDFKGDFVLESVGASVYSYWYHLFHQSLLSEYTYKGKKGSQLKSEEEDDIFWNEKRRILLIDNYMFSTTFMRMMEDINKDPVN
tara:strand:- start:540 stop:806 length:267 start_codon:yes stop_codon:yes gene_type:complete